MGGYVVAHLKRDIVQLGEKLRRILFSKCICFYWFLVFLKFWIFGILNTYFSTTISVISDLVLLSFELRILNFGFFKSHCQPLNFGFFLWSWALKTRLEGSVFFAGGVLRIERMLTRLVAQEYEDHFGIDWSEVLKKHKEFTGHTASSLGWIFAKCRNAAKA